MRKTFRPADESNAWQKQLRDRFMDEGTPDVPHLSLKKAQVRPVSRRLAKKIILKYEWLGTMAPSSYHYGLFFGEFCAGVTCAGTACTAGANTHKQYSIRRDELMTLARGACVHWAPPGTNSKLVAWTCRLLACDSGAKVLVAYADTDAGEIGTIYQACSWTYIGRSDSPDEWISPHGRSFNANYPYNLAESRGGTGLGWKRTLLSAGWRTQKANPKHRYIQVLDKSDDALVRRVERMRQPYPKRPTRAESIDSDAMTFQVKEGGANPTSALHIDQKEPTP